jgi:hypothetical protein
MSKSNQTKADEPDSLPYECELCGTQEDIPLEVIDHFDKVDPGLPGQPPTFACEQSTGIMYPLDYLRAQRAEPEAS